MQRVVAVGQHPARAPYRGWTFPRARAVGRADIHRDARNDIVRCPIRTRHSQEAGWHRKGWRHHGWPVKAIVSFAITCSSSVAMTKAGKRLWAAVIRPG